MLWPIKRIVRSRGRHAHEETGAALLVVLAIISLVGMWVATTLNTVNQTARATHYNLYHTQALYNARMGVDTVLYYLSENEATLFASSSGPTTVGATVTNDLAKLNAPPFQVSVAFGPETGSSGSYLIPTTIVSVGQAGISGVNGARVTLTIPANITETTTGQETGAGSGSSSGSSGSSSTSETTSISVNATNGIGVQAPGLDDSTGTSGGPDVSVSASNQVTVTGFTNLNTVSGNNSSSTPPNNESDWIAGNEDTTTGPVNGTAIVTGTGDTIEDSVNNGEAIVTGLNDTLDAPVDGPLIMTGKGDTLGSNADVNGCIAIVSGDNDVIDGDIDGVLIVTGNHDTFGTANNFVPLNSGVILLGSDDTFYASVDGLPSGKGSTIPTGTAVIALGTGDVINYQNFNGSVDEYGDAVTLHGLNLSNIAINQIASTETYTVDASCLGDMTLSVAPPASGSSSSLAHISLSFGSSSVEG